ncbi:hypothetical protein AB6D11_27240 [Vibrio splendidus]
MSIELMSTICGVTVWLFQMYCIARFYKIRSGFIPLKPILGKLEGVKETRFGRQGMISYLDKGRLVTCTNFCITDQTGRWRKSKVLKHLATLKKGDQVTIYQHRTNYDVAIGVSPEGIHPIKLWIALLFTTFILYHWFTASLL